MLWLLRDHDLAVHDQDSFAVVVDGQTVSGTLWYPASPARAAVVLVHGDGPQDRTSAGGYAPLINVFLEAGLAVASWDKPGIGASGGNWLDQSMDDRAVETRSVLALLKDRFGGIPVGAVGFSQAGWVLPKLTQVCTDFIVLIGPAVSWQDQGDYFTRVRLQREGLSPAEISAALVAEKRADAHAFGEGVRFENAPHGMSRDRWQFIQRNRLADARTDLVGNTLPFMAVWGADDLNVSSELNSRIYRELLGNRAVDTRIEIWPDATHGLLTSRHYNWQLTNQWGIFAYLRFLIQGRDAFAPGALEAITNWIAKQSVRAA